MNQWQHTSLSALIIYVFIILLCTKRSTFLESVTQMLKVPSLCCILPVHRSMCQQKNCTQTHTHTNPFDAKVQHLFRWNMNTSHLWVDAVEQNIKTNSQKRMVKVPSLSLSRSPSLFFSHIQNEQSNWKNDDNNFYIFQIEKYQKDVISTIFQSNSNNTSETTSYSKIADHSHGFISCIVNR